MPGDPTLPPMPSTGPIADYLQTPGKLTSRLAAISTRKQLQNAVVGLQVAGHRLFAAIEAGQSRIDEAPRTPVAAGCLTKTLTATLAAEAVASQQLDWDTEINAILRIEGRERCGLGRITFNQLLNHTHGLDGSDIVQTPLTAAGWVDAPALCHKLAARPLSSPGTLYSYSDTGARLTGAALERLYGKPCGELLGASEVIGSTCAWGAAALPVCPANGGGLELTISQWLSFLDAHLRAGTPATGPARRMAELRAATVPLPGWSAAERAIARGWKYYGGGWFGHNANMGDRSALLRFNPQEATAIVLAASGDGAFFALAGLFGTALPEFANLRPPRLLTAHERNLLRIEQYPGIYTQSRMRIEVTALPANTLSLSIHSHESADEPPRRLRPAQDHIFIPEPGGHPELPYVQFVSSPGSDHFDYLWNGKQLWRRD